MKSCNEDNEVVVHVSNTLPVPQHACIDTMNEEQHERVVELQNAFKQWMEE